MTGSGSDWGYGLGRHVHHDPASKAYPYEAADGPPRTVTHRHSGAVLDQGQVGSCTGNALAQACNTAPLRRRGEALLTEADAVELYTRATHLDNVPGEYPAQDTGSSGLAVCKAAARAGLIGGYRHAFGLDETLAAVAETPVIIGIPWHAGMFDPDAGGYLHPTGPVVGGHELAVIGVHVGLQRVTLLNSWGPGWGRHGRAYLTWADLDTLLADDGDCTVPLQTPTPEVLSDPQAPA